MSRPHTDMNNARNTMNVIIPLTSWQHGELWVATLNTTWPPKVGKIMAFMAIIMGLGLLFYIPLGFRYTLTPKTLKP